VEGSTREGILDQGASEQIHARTEPCWTNDGLGAGRGRGGAWRLRMRQSVSAHGGGRRGCGCRRGGSPCPREKQQEAVGSELERDPWPPRRVHWRRRCGALGVGAWCHSFFFVCSQASSPGRDVRGARSKPQMGEKPSITCKKSAIEFGLSVLLAFNFIRYKILCILFWAHNSWRLSAEICF